MSVIVIKYGGSLLEDPVHRRGFLTSIASLAKKEKVILVHGGGKEITKAFEEKGIPTVFKQGLRVTPDQNAMTVVEAVLKDINKRITQELKALGVEAKGYSGKSRQVMLAHPINEDELGLVGLPFDVKPDILETIVAESALPVFYSVATDESGRTLNINADEFAWKIAVSYPGQAQRLIFLTDSGGVIQNGKLLDKIPAYQVQDLVDSQVITGGMIVKAFACRDAIVAGVPQVDIAKGIRISKKTGEFEIEGTSFIKVKTEKIKHGH
jgi:acetylglutamate kinase